LIGAGIWSKSRMVLDAGSERATWINIGVDDVQNTKHRHRHCLDSTQHCSGSDSR
jgi:hypothetical protein